METNPHATLSTYVTLGKTRHRCTARKSEGRFVWVTPELPEEYDSLADIVGALQWRDAHRHYLRVRGLLPC